MEGLLVKAFEASLVADNESLRNANKYLESIKNNEQVIPSCVSIALSSQSLEIRQLSVIYLKNLTHHWKDSRREIPLPDSSKEYLKANIINCLLYSVPHKIRSQFEEIAFVIAKAEFPWDAIISQIDVFLTSKNADQVFAALCMIYQISKVYEQVLNEKRNNLKILVSKFFSQLSLLLNELLLEENDQRFKYISLILQIFWTCFYIDFPEEQATIGALQGWLEKCKTILEMSFKELEAPLGSDEDSMLRDEDPKWQCKKWAAQIIYRFFNRYFNLAYLKGYQKLIGEYFQTNWAEALTKIALSTLIQSQHKYLPNSVSNYLLKFITQAFKLNATIELLNSYSKELILYVIIPFLNRKPEDEDCWQNNPIEYIRNENDIGKAYFSSKSSAIDLLKVMCEISSLPYLMGIISENLQNHSNEILKESMLYALGALNKVIKTNKTYLPVIENLLYNYALPEFTNPIGFIRSRACFLYSNYTDIHYSIPGHQENVFICVCRLMMDSELPVRVEAATSLPKLLTWDVSKPKLRMEIHNVLTVYLDLMNQIDFEDLVESLEDIINFFSNEVTPFAIEFSQHLSRIFISIVGKDNDDSVMAAISILSTLKKLIDILDDKPEDLYKLSIDLQEVFDIVFMKPTLDLFEPCLLLLTSLLYYSPSNHLPHLFKYLALLASQIIDTHTDKIKEPFRDIIEKTFEPFANYLQKYKELSKENLVIFLKVAAILVSDGYQEIITGCKIFMAVLENSQIDTELVIQVFGGAYKVFFDQESKKIRMLFVQIVLVALWRNTLIGFQCLKSLGCAEEVFRFIYENYMMIKEEIPVAQLLLGLGSMIAVHREIGEPGEWINTLIKVLLLVYKRVFGTTQKQEEFKSDEPEYMNMMSKLRLMQEFEDCKDYDESGDDLYESIFEIVDVKSFLQSSFLRCSDLIGAIVFTVEEQKIITNIMN